MEIFSVVLALFSGAVGALIGTYYGSLFISKRQEAKIVKVREIAQKALAIIKGYAKERNTYNKASEQFNNGLTVSEKRAVLVALHKLGIPVDVPSKDIFSIKNVRFISREIDREEVEGMIQQINSGNCDHLFYLDVDSYFSSNIRLNSIRSVGKKYVTEVLLKSKLNKEKEVIEFPDRWADNFTRGELNVVLVFKSQLNSPEYFDLHGIPQTNKIDQLLSEIEIGIWDSYLFWEFEAYQNILSQKHLADTVANQILSQQQNLMPTNNEFAKPSKEE